MSKASASRIETPRLCLRALSPEELALCLDDIPALERQLGLAVSRDVFSLRVQRAIGMKLDKMGKADPCQYEWFTYWLVIVKPQDFGAGLVGFKGYPGVDGKTEIGYGIDPAYQGQGYATEAVRVLVDWALAHPFCRAVTATEVSNPASRRVLEKLGAQLIEETEDRSSWEFRRASSRG